MDRAGNRQRLTLTSRQTADEAVAVGDSCYPEVPHRLDRDFIGALAVQALEGPPTLRWLFAHKERASDAHQRERSAKLVDGRNAVVAGIARAAENDNLATHFDRAGCRPVDPGEDLDQGRLPGAVVAKQAQDLTRVHLERDVVKNIDRTERLVDVGQFKQRGRHFCPFPFAGEYDNASFRNVLFISTAKSSRIPMMRLAQLESKPV